MNETQTQNSKTTTIDYQYDQNGSQTSRTTTEHNGNKAVETSVYDGKGRLTQVMAGGVQTSYAYRPDGLRHSKSRLGSSTTHAWDFADIAAENTTDALGVTTSAIYMRGNGLVYTKSADGVHLYQKNAHGDIVQYLNSNGNATSTYVYDAFGVQRAPNVNANDKNNFRYCGEYRDGETGTYYLRARHYQPATGRFTSQDTHWNPGNMVYGDSGNGGNPSIASVMQSSNLYVYCGNNPVMFIDSTGEFGTPISWALAVIAGVAGGVYGNYLANQLGYKGLKKAALVAGVAVGGAIIGFIAGELLVGFTQAFLVANQAVLASLPSGVLSLFGITAGASGLYNIQITSALSNIISNTVTHIMQAKHAWDLVGATNWSGVSNVINTVLTKGSGVLNQAGNMVYSYVMNGQTIEVTTRIVDGVLRIVDAWVKTK